MHRARDAQVAVGQGLGVGGVEAHLLGGLDELGPHLVGLAAQQPRDRDTERVGLQHREDERPQLGNVGSLLHRAECFGARRPDPRLAQHPAELVGKWTRDRSGRALHCLFETEAGLDRDHEQVEDVRKLDGDVVLALFDGARGLIALLDPVISKPTWTSVVFEHYGLGEAMKHLFETNPDLAESISWTIAERRASLAAGSQQLAQASIEESAGLLSSIKRFFGLR